jgi:hypothetical protein
VYRSDDLDGDAAEHSALEARLLAEESPDDANATAAREPNHTEKAFTQGPTLASPAAPQPRVSSAIGGTAHFRILGASIEPQRNPRQH